LMASFKGKNFPGIPCLQKHRLQNCNRPVSVPGPAPIIF
jgi:hypothetical protein